MKDRLLAAVLVASGIFLCYSLATKAFSTALYYDDAYNASVSRNIAVGAGYASSYEEMRWFNPDVTTGPALLLPGALAVGVFGNHPWAIHGAAVVVNLLLLGWLLSLIARREEKFLGESAVIFLGLLLFFTTEPRGPGGGVELGPLRLWYQLVGEIPSTLTALLGAFLLFDFRPRRSRAFLGGFLLGLALLFKVIAVLIALPLLAIFTRRAGTRAFPAWIGFAAPSIAWIIYKHLSLESSDIALALATTEWDAILHMGSGLGPLLAAPSPWRHIVSYVPWHLGILKVYFGGWPWLAFALAVIAASGWFLIRSWHRSQRADPEGSVLIPTLYLTGAVYGLWWLTLSAGAIRHLVPAIICFIAALSLGFPRLTTREKRITAAGFFLLALPQLPRQAELFHAPRTEPRLTASLDTARYLEDLQRGEAGSILVGCGWWVTRDIEFLLPKPLNFRDCLALPADAFGSTRILLVRAADYWNWHGKPVLDAFAASCDREILFRKPPFIVSRCLVPP